MPDIIIQIAGWTGTLLIVLAYFLVSFKKIESSSKAYQSMNFFGAMGIGINVFYHQAWPAFIMEVIWTLIAVFALINLLKARKQ